ncbi:Mth938-like domain-containing protein [Massilia sp. W12]|uniref:Mth938-like domain-containing protein n=1 Tax=Massilia sp. W12 TaxID=3126507 RepID=UPI0030CF9A49
MKLHQTASSHYQTVTGYDELGVHINGQRYAHSLLVLPEIAPVAWAGPSFEALCEDDFARIAAHQPDLVILGTGARQRFIHPRLSAALAAQRIGVECMDSKAACRTYNILMTEGRKVALALIL